MNKVLWEHEIGPESNSQETDREDEKYKTLAYPSHPIVAHGRVTLHAQRPARHTFSGLLDSPRDSSFQSTDPHQIAHISIFRVLYSRLPSFQIHHPHTNLTVAASGGVACPSPTISAGLRSILATQLHSPLRPLRPLKHAFYRKAPVPLSLVSHASTRAHSHHAHGSPCS